MKLLFFFFALFLSFSTSAAFTLSPLMLQHKQSSFITLSVSKKEMIDGSTGSSAPNNNKSKPPRPMGNKAKRKAKAAAAAAIADAINGKPPKKKVIYA